MWSSEMHKNRGGKKSNRHKLMCDIWMLLCAFGLYLYLVLVFVFDFILFFYLLFTCYVCMRLKRVRVSLDFIAVLAINNGALSTAAKKLRKNQRFDQQLEQSPNAKWNYKQIVNSKSNKWNAHQKFTWNVNCMYFYTVYINKDIGVFFCGCYHRTFVWCCIGNGKSLSNSLSLWQIDFHCCLIFFAAINIPMRISLSFDASFKLSCCYFHLLDSILILLPTVSRCV